MFAGQGGRQTPLEQYVKRAVNRQPRYRARTRRAGAPRKEGFELEFLRFFQIEEF